MERVGAHPLHAGRCGRLLLLPFQKPLEGGGLLGGESPSLLRHLKGHEGKVLVHALMEPHDLHGLEVGLDGSRIPSHHRAGERRQGSPGLYVFQGGPYDRVEGLEDRCRSAP